MQDNYNTFHLAVLHSREDVIRLLVTRKADISALAGVRLTANRSQLISTIIKE